MQEVVLLKLGGSLITDKRQAFIVRQDVLDRIAEELTVVARDFPDLKLIVGHGSGSFGHYVAEKHGFDGVTSSQAVADAISQAATDLHLLVLKSFKKAGLSVRGLRPVDCDVTALRGTLDNSETPVTYGDIMKTVKGFEIFSTEKVFDVIIKDRGDATDWRISKVIMLGEVEGVYSVDQKKEIIPLITSENFNEVYQSLNEPDGFDVTGGMQHKLEMAASWSQLGIETIIASGLKPGVLAHLFKGNYAGSTRFLGGEYGLEEVLSEAEEHVKNGKFKIQTVDEHIKDLKNV